jgi:hypothetical protein
MSITVIYHARSLTVHVYFVYDTYFMPQLVLKEDGALSALFLVSLRQMF